MGRKINFDALWCIAYKVYSFKIISPQGDGNMEGCYIDNFTCFVLSKLFPRKGTKAIQSTALHEARYTLVVRSPVNKTIKISYDEFLFVFSETIAE